jgi:glycosyltransferase involved in cell wall biosynthesis
MYHHLAKHLRQVNFITYGGWHDQAYAHQLAPIQIHATPSHLPVLASRMILQRFHQSALRQSDILKTNQIPGAEIAMWFKKRYQKKLITRCGYLFSRFMEEQGRSEQKIRRAYTLEREAFNVADAGVVTSERDKAWVIENHHIDSNKMHVIPNYVITDVFKPLHNAGKNYDLVCVAKRAPQKNLHALLTAMHELKQRGLAVSLLLIGSAAEDEIIRRQAKELQLSISFTRRIANFELPAYLNQAQAFVLPSLYEGHPKALLEAMSCGLPCIGTDVVGIREDLRHQRNGYLCTTEPSSLANAIHTVLSSLDLQHRLGRNARRYIVERYSLEAVLESELALISKLVS